MKHGLPTLALAGAVLLGSGAMAFAQTAESSSWGWQHPRQEGARATHALNMLESNGDGQFSNFAADGQNFSANVMKNGQSTQVIINPDTGTIRPADTAS